MFNFLLKTFFPFLFLSLGDEGPGASEGDAEAQKELESLIKGGENPPEGEETPGADNEGSKEDKQKEEAKGLGLPEDATTEDIETAKKKKETEEAGEKEIDLGDLGKFKTKDLKDMLDKAKDYTKKTQDLSEKEKGVKELQDWASVVKGNKKAIDFIVKFSQKLVNAEGEYDEAMLDRTVNALEKKVEQAQEGLEAQEGELQKQLEELDPDSPLYKVVKTSLDQIKQLQARLDKADENTKKAKEQKTDEDYQSQVKRAQQVYNSTLDDLADSEKDDSLKFETQASKKIWRSLVASYMKDNQKEYKDEDDFIGTLKDVGKACHKTLSDFSESVVAEYIKTKKGPEPKKKPVDEGEPSITDESTGERKGLEGLISGELEKEIAGNTS